MLELEPNSFCVGINPDNIEAASGYHAENLLALVDESSALTAAKNEAINSWDPAKRVYLGNPLRPDGPFYEMCTRQRLQPDPSVALIKIPSTESPAIKMGLRRSPDGFVGLDWLEDNRRDYGEDSTWWQSHVLAEFPDTAEGQLLPRDWIDRSIYAEYLSEDSSKRCLAIDLAAGRGGDRTVLLVRSANQIIHLEASNTLSLEDAAAKAAHLVRDYHILPSRVVYDHSGLGEGFRLYLQQNGLFGAAGFQGGAEAKGFRQRFENMKSACAWRLRQRFDAKLHPQAFGIPREWASHMRPELQSLTYEVTSKDRIKLTDKDTIKSRVGRSPDLADALIMSFVVID